MSNICPQDADFGPVSTCRNFDFTIAFESSILAIPASGIFILLCVVTLHHLKGKPRLMQPYRYLPSLGKQLVGWKVGVATAATIADLVALAAWVSQLTSTPGNTLVIASLALRSAASLLQIPLAYLEFFRRYQASPLLPLYLTIVTLCDIARIRTFAITFSHVSPFFFGTFVTGFSCRALSWLLETAPKGAFVERAEGDRYISAEETSSFFAKLFITCVDPVLLKGFRHDLTPQSLGLVQSRYEAEYLYEVGRPLWEKHIASGKRFPLLRTMFSAFGSTLLAPILPCIVYSLASITQPTLVNHVINFVESYQTGDPADREPVSHGWGLVGAYALVFLTSTLSWSLFQMSALRSAVAMRGLLVQMIYQKALRVHQDTAKEVGAGSSTSLMSVDVERIVVQCEPFHLPYSAIIMPGDSIRQNIQFQGAFNPALYRTVVKACALDTDFRIWPEGDKQKAQGLSGGQKQRIALARSLYARPELLILDDVFSAVDKTTEEHIFSALFGANGLLEGRTVILATNAVHRLPSADHIIIIDGQTVKQEGSFNALSSEPGAVSELMNIVGEVSRSTQSDRGTNILPPPDDVQSSFVSMAENANEEMEAEMAASQARKNSVLVYLFNGGRILMCMALTLMVVSSAMPSIIPVYIQAWTTAIQQDAGRLFTYMGGYIGVEFGHITAFIISLFYFYTIWSAASSRRLHAREVTSIFRTPLSYFEDKPIGRILSRFSQDLYVTDFELPMAFGNLVGLGVEMLATIIILTIAAPYVGIILFGTIVICVLAQRFYVRTSRQVRRMDLIAKSPLYTLFAETMDTAGLKTIRAMRAQESLSKQCIAKGNSSQVPYYLMWALKKWLNLVLGMVVTIINVGLVTVAVAFRSKTSSGLLAVALVQATSLVFTLSFVVLAAAEFETCLVAVSRIQEVIELPREEDGTGNGALPLILADSDEKGGGPDEKAGSIPSKVAHTDWITAGSIMFQNVVLRYKPELPPALNSISFKVQGGQKVGIVGRTGCGKSTVLQALFRMIECESGQIHIDGIDIRQLPRKTLRQALTIIPQDPLLLELSVRENLDLENVKTDQEIWAALEKTQCKPLIEALPDKLDTIIAGDGGNFSRGERQLLAMTRALLRSKKILVLDEASSSLDVATDATIQKVLREVFANCTIIAIAHRLNTLLDFDQVIVLSHGEVIETGKPSELAKRPQSAFSQLLHGSGASEVVLSSMEDSSSSIIAEL
ncbi:P-loop containing nucleoside triphosphate hydrolase protein [Cystobasidium minutum MCA 4210]|uniref:P-loop containing nucleoside triphosphate hydrolase protein n=1 Tax=Cystobasidium minutum MCA 4210 TaxID=1397322 RepID=UPI0034CFB1A8|eukprot:jgi/Rhomi1/207334/estExt_Genemark1.C_1_t10224